MSVLDFLHLGSSLSLRGIGRFGSCIAVADRVAFGTPNTYIHFSDANNDALLNFYVTGHRGLSVMTESDIGGGNLHGIWYSDHIVHTSDRRLKKNIRPLMESLDARAVEKGVTGDSARWLLRELRPVSYQFKQGAEAKGGAKLQRFGFIADEVQATIPQVIVEKPTGDRIKGILYEDLVAILTTALQSVQSQVEGTDAVAQGTRRRLDDLEARLLLVEQAVTRQVDSFEERLAARLNAIEAAIDRRLPDLRASPTLHTTVHDGGARSFDTAAASGAERNRNWTYEGHASPGYEVIV